MFIQKIKLWIWRSLEKRQPAIIDVEKLPENEKKVFFNNCKMLSEDETLKQIVGGIIKDREDYISRKAVNRPFETTEAELERYGIIILEELQDRLKNYASRLTKPEDFNKFSIL